MTESLLLEDVGGGVTVLTLNRAPVNALTPDYLGVIEAQLSDIEADPGIRALVITSGLTVFSAGMDLMEAQAFSTTDERAVVDGLNSTCARLFGLSKPVIAAVNGAAIAGGLFFILASDYSVAREGAKVGLTEVRVGLNFPIAALEIARATLSPGVFRRMVLGGHTVDASAAERMGILDVVTSADDLMPRALAAARDYAAIPTIAFASVKAQMRAQALDIMNDAVARKSDPARAGWFTGETREAMAQLLEAARRRA